MPGNFGSYIVNPSTHGTFDIKRTDDVNLDSVLAGWDLPDNVKQFLSNIKYAEEATYHSMGFVLSRDASSIDEYVVSGKNNDGIIVVSYVHSYSRGSVV